MQKSEIHLSAMVNRMIAEKRGIAESTSEQTQTETKTEIKKMKTDPRILYVMTQTFFCGIKLPDKPPAVSESECPPTPSFVAEICLESKGLPTEMGFLKYNSEIFLFGGSFSSGIFSLDPGFVPNLDVYKFNPSARSLERTDDIPQMKAYKSLPLVEQVGDKIFVRHLCFPWILNQRPFLECYNTATGGEWTEVPDLPSLSFVGHWVGDTCFVVCNKMFFRLVDDGEAFIQCFDTDLEIWDETSAENLAVSLSKAGLEWPQRGRSFSGLAKSISQHCSLIVSYRSVETPIAQIIDKSGFLLFHQELNLPLFSGHISNVLGIVHNLVVDMEDGQHMCLVYLTALDGAIASQIRPVFALYICIFEVNILRDAYNDILPSVCDGTDRRPLQSKTFINTRVKEEYWYKMPDLAGDDGHNSMKAFFF